MDTSLIVLAVVSLVFSAFFSGLEVAFTASNTLLLTLEESQNKTVGAFQDIFRRNPSNFLTSVLVGNTLSLVCFCLVSAKLLYEIEIGGLFWVIVILWCVVVCVAEFLPRVIVIRAPALYYRAFVIPAFVFYILFYPISAFCGWISYILLRIFGCRVQRGVLLKGFDTSDLQNLVEEEMAQSTPLENEMRLLHNAFDFSQVRVRECMVPRVEIEAFDVEGSIEELRKLFVSTKFSRIPIYRDTVDTIIGYASSRQLFEHPESIEKMLRLPLYVPSSALVRSLLEDFVRARKSMAIVIDEFGATAGLITIEDILEEIFGEIDDEHDGEYFVGKELPDGGYLLSGRAELDDLLEKFGIEIPQSEDYETLGGYILYTIGDMPQVGHTFSTSGYNFTVERISHQRISLVKVTPLKNNDPTVTTKQDK